MTSRDFCFWLQGFIEISSEGLAGGSISLNREQTDSIKKHLNLVFKHEIDPSMGGQEHQQELNNIHSGGIQPSKDNVVLRC